MTQLPYPDADTAIRDVADMLSTLFAGVSEGFIQLYIEPPGPGAYRVEHIPLPDFEAAARAVVEAREKFDVYFGPAPRVARPWYDEGGRHHRVTVVEVPALWADIDSPEGVAEVVTFTLEPSIVVQSGTPGHLHVYWLLKRPIEPHVAEELNRLLAERLGADRRVTAASWNLRLPGTVNRKRMPYQEVRLAWRTRRRYTPRDVRDAVVTSGPH